MSQADIIYNDLIKDVYENGTWDKGQEVRTKYADGTPAYTRSVFGRQVTFEEGEIPLLTTKFVGSKTAAKEMQLFWVQQTVKKEDFDAWNVRVWDEWFLPDGTLGKSYAYQFESRPQKEVVKVAARRKGKHSSLKEILVSPPQKPNSKPTHNAKYVGNIYQTKDFGEYIVLDSYLKKEYSNPRILVQFLKTGYIKETDVASVILQRNVKDNYARSFFGIGYLGNTERLERTMSKELYRKLYRRWFYILERCYSPTADNYGSYGEKGVFVDERWHSFEHFLEDIMYLPNYFIAKQSNFEDYDLDKDYYSSNCYSRETCVWLKRGENLLYSNNPTAITLIKPDGTEELFISIADAEKTHGLTNLAKVVKGERESVRGYRAEAANDLGEYESYRYKLSQNQVVDLLNNIKFTPMSRRLMTSFWNDADVNQKALQECAMQTTWNVRGDRLDLLLYSRSLDLALGCPYNWIQYWFLLQMVAQATGYKPGRFTHQIGNAHYYDRHEDLLLEQIGSEQHEQPEFWINKEVMDFFQFTPDDLGIKEYKHNGKFEYEVAI